MLGPEPPDVLAIQILKCVLAGLHAMQQMTPSLPEIAASNDFRSCP
jgi:hypothetical protein